MDKTILVIIPALLSIFFFSLVSATNLSGGECETFEFPNSNPVNFEIVSNTSSMEGFKWNQNGTQITYCLSLDFSPQHFEVRWYNEKAEEHRSGGSSNGGSGGSCLTQWTCTEWGECMGNIQARSCTYPENFCEPRDKKPSEIRICEDVVKEKPETKPKIPEDKEPNYSLILALIMILIMVGLYYVLKGGKKT